MIYILGIITGILLSAFLILIDILIHKKVNRGGIQQVLRRAAQEKGSILEASEDGLEDFINSLPTQ